MLTVLYASQGRGWGGQVLTIPLDTAKVRLQVQPKSATPKYKCAPTMPAMLSHNPLSHVGHDCKCIRV